MIEPAVSRVGAIARYGREKISQLGVPGLMLYNGVKGVAAGAIAFSMKEGDVTDKLQYGGAVAGLAIITSQTFWAAMVMIGHKALRR